MKNIAVGFVHRLRITKAEGEEKEGREEMGLFSNGVKRSDIVEGDHIYSWRTLFIYAHHGEQSDPASTVVRRANYLFENGFGNYHLVRNNCEDFALYCKTGILVLNQGVGKSGQVASVFRGLSPFVAAIYFLVRKDGTKVPVEEVNKKIKVPVENMDKFHRHEFDAALIRATFPPIY
ncbi:hypothetical protein RHMOL_Rhmol07G0095100 [Rhododendron molle]|uniref:Uncharacterized protein n=1 Tax=Rhododendron molle TaxID=49168 RepID=A0ACC0MZH4_RHOML|nr:hypothetical protein RHMOL_Rhmol07G0095100 [Rhododendron molle]